MDNNNELDSVAIAEIIEVLKVKLEMHGYDKDSEILLKQIIELAIKMYLNRTVTSDNLH